MQASGPAARVRSLGVSKTVPLTFAFATGPYAFTVGYVLYKSCLYVQKPPRCATCGRPGNAAKAIRSPSSYVRCDKNPEGKESTTAVPHCANYGKEHMPTFHRCPRWQKKKIAARYRRLNYIDYSTGCRTVKENAGETTALQPHIS